MSFWRKNVHAHGRNIPGNRRPGYRIGRNSRRNYRGSHPPYWEQNPHTGNFHLCISLRRMCPFHLRPVSLQHRRMELTKNGMYPTEKSSAELFFIHFSLCLSPSCTELSIFSFAEMSKKYPKTRLMKLRHQYANEFLTSRICLSSSASLA